MGSDQQLTPTPASRRFGRRDQELEPQAAGTAVDVRRRGGQTVSQPRFELLESRQLLSATVDLRLPGGGKTVEAATIGQVIPMELWVTVKGSNASGTDDGFQSLIGSLVSTELAGPASVAGNLQTANVTPFDALGSQPGTPTDLNGDGSLDVGGTDPSSANGFFAVRSGGITTSGTVQGATKSFMVGIVNYTVTALGSGGQTSVNFLPKNVGPS